MVIRAITLIAVLRLGLVAELKDHAYRDFVKLPLYEDMAPWNIVFQGGTLDYIDYDTKDKTFSKVVPLAYQVMSVLMNYKRTVEDFGKCGTKAGNPYNFPFVSDCVRSRDYSHPSPKCEDPKEPVACSDGHCRSDYISCLKVCCACLSLYRLPPTYSHCRLPTLLLFFFAGYRQNGGEAGVAGGGQGAPSGTAQDVGGQTAARWRLRI
jgi:hypothetical protein